MKLNVDIVDDAHRISHRTRKGMQFTFFLPDDQLKAQSMEEIEQSMTRMVQRYITARKLKLMTEEGETEE